MLRVLLLLLLGRQVVGYAGIKQQIDEALLLVTLAKRPSPWPVVGLKLGGHLLLERLVILGDVVERFLSPYGSHQFHGIIFAAKRRR
uniref:Putative secreted protein n=1 Tax=Anopheles darlingi TaxID=43151 RepID=A0A2M4D2Q9_ANODA